MRHSHKKKKDNKNNNKILNQISKLVLSSRKSKNSQKCLKKKKKLRTSKRTCLFKFTTPSLISPLETLRLFFKTPTEFDGHFLPGPIVIGTTNFLCCVFPSSSSFPFFKHNNGRMLLLHPPSTSRQSKERKLLGIFPKKMQMTSFFECVTYSRE